MAKKLVVIDGKSIFYRGYYAMPNLSTKDGRATGGVYGFTVLALEVIKRLKPDYVCVAWDKSGTNIRRRLEIYPEYKAGRKKAPDDFYAQIPILIELLDALSWPFYEFDDFEADDIMATLARKADAQGLETVLISSDLDLLQAVTDTTSMYALKKGLSNIQEFKPKDFEAKYGVRVDQFADLKALKGDSSDNIPGVAGVGEKAAVELLQKYDTLDEIYENIDLIKDSVRKKLVASKDMAYTSKQLVELMFDAPVELEFDRLDVTDLDIVRLKNDLRDLEFHSLINQLPASMDSGEPEAEEEAQTISIPELKLIDSKSLSETDLIPDDKLVPAKIFSDGDRAELYMLCSGSRLLKLDLSNSEQVKALASSKLMTEVTLASDDVKELLKQLVRSGLPMTMLRGFGPRNFDVTLASFIRNSLIRDQSLSGLAQEFLGLSLTTGEDQDIQALTELSLISQLANLQQTFFGDPKNKSLAEVYSKIDGPAISSLAEIELIGMKLDADYLIKMEEELTGRISDLEQTIYGLADEEFNIASPAQLAEILFTKLELPTRGVKKGKTGYSTAANELAKLVGLHPIIEYISQYRELTKLKSTYVDTLPSHQADDGRIHSTLSQTVAATGRLSSSDPNLQNIPVRTEVGKLIRNAFVAEPGNILISADYSQFELRLAALLAKDKGMIDAFNSDIDIHTLTASQVFGVPLEDVTKTQRYSAKTVNFGILYGQGAHALAQQTGMTYGEAKDFIDKYFEQRSALKDYIRSLRELAKDQGYVATLYGRRRPTPDVESPNFMVREGAYRQAVNMPIQGTEADLMKMAMIKLDDEFDKQYTGSEKDFWARPRQIMQVHDSIIVECKQADAEAVATLMVEVMENIDPSLGVKLKVDWSSGATWGQL